jgi:uncharacterized protein YqjF (DUF2071 family)
MTQIWRDLLFAHWRVRAAAVRPLVNRRLELDTFDGEAWISVTPFHMSVRPRGMPILPGMSALPELNCRTYVRTEGKPGVFFFSLDTASRAAVVGARAGYHLPYFHARMRVTKCDGTISYSSHRGQSGWQAEYGPNAPVAPASPETLEHWLTERYCLYTAWRDGVYRGEIHHAPWPLQRAWAKIEENSVPQAAGLEASGPPALLAFSRELKVLIWSLRRIG